MRSAAAASSPTRSPASTTCAPSSGRATPSWPRATTLVVPSVDRYGRSLKDLVTVVAELRERGVGFTSLHENLDTPTPGGRLTVHVFAHARGVHQQAHRRGDERGPGRRRARGRTGARPSVITPELLRAARDMLHHRESSIESIANSSASSPAPSTTTSPPARTTGLRPSAFSSKAVPGSSRRAVVALYFTLAGPLQGALSQAAHSSRPRPRGQHCPSAASPRWDAQRPARSPAGPGGGRAPHSVRLVDPPPRTTQMR
jgi:hypothetical protein